MKPGGKFELPHLVSQASLQDFLYDTRTSLADILGKKRNGIQQLFYLRLSIVNDRIDSVQETSIPAIRLKLRALKIRSNFTRSSRSLQEDCR